MLSPEYYERCADDILKLYEQLENDIISDIIRRMMKTGKVTESAKHQAEVLQDAGILYDDILAEIAKRTDATENHVRTLFEDTGVETVNFDNEVYHENGLTPVDIRQSPAMRQTLEAGYKKTFGSMKNLTLTTAVTAQTGFINACNQAYMQVSSGAFSYQEAIKQAIKKTAENGAIVLYPSGHQERIDVAVRRAVLTGVGQTCREIGKMNAEKSGCDLMEITAHSGARPDHAKWQGQLVSLSGKNAGRIINGKKVLSLRQAGYGTGDGIFGWNCRHDWFPFFEGCSVPVYTDKDLKKLDEKNIEYNGIKYSKYEISQIQRRYEREIKAAKREQTAFKTAVQEADNPKLKQVMRDSLNYVNDAVKRKQAKMRDFISQTGQRRDYFREQNYADKNIRNSLTYAENNGIIIKVPETLSGYEKAKDKYMKKIKNAEIMKPENRKVVEKALETLIDEGDFCMRIEESTLKIIVDSADRRFKTQMETGMSGGAYNPELRKELAETLFGADFSKVPNNSFEKYGFLTGKDKSRTFANDEAEEYGNLIVQLKKEKLFNRTTYTVGDSLDNVRNGSSIFAGKVSEPSVCAAPLDDFTDNIIQASKDFNNNSINDISEFCEKSMVDYIELQYHGELTLDDAEIVYYQESIGENLKKNLEKSGIKVKKVE